MIRFGKLVGQLLALFRLRFDTRNVSRQNLLVGMRVLGIGRMLILVELVNNPLPELLDAVHPILVEGEFGLS